MSFLPIEVRIGKESAFDVSFDLFLKLQRPVLLHNLVIGTQTSLFIIAFIGFAHPQMRVLTNNRSDKPGPL